jgi:glycosyltransferase involved in cell wall biosynthesis
VDFYRRLAKSDALDLHVAYGDTMPGSALPAVKTIPDVPVHRLENVIIGPKQALIVQKGVIETIAEIRPKVVIAEFSPRILTNLRLLRLRRKYGFRLVYWGHGIEPESGPAAIRIRLRMANAADALITYSGPQRENFIQLGLPEQKVFAAWNSINTDDSLRLRTPFDPDERNRIVVIGRVNAFKRVDLVINAFARAFPRLPERIKLTIIGEGPALEEIRELAKSLDIADRVEITGAIYARDAEGKVTGAPEEMIAPYLNDSLFSVTGGPIGLNLIQTMAYGVPMLLAEGEHHPPEICAAEIGENAAQFKAGDVEDLANRMVELVNDAATLRKLSAGSVQTIERRFNLATMAKGFEDAVRYVTSL